MSKRIALVTGASRGIGKAVAARLRRAGLELLVPRRAELDVMSRTSIDAYVAKLKVPVDVLVNNAGMNRIAALADIADADVDATLALNLDGPLHLSRALAPGMAGRRRGWIVNISSVFSVVSRPGRIVYSISKAGLNALTRSLAVELGPSNVLVNAVAPGYVDTDLTRANNTAAQLGAIRRTIPLHRLARPAEIAEVVAFLCGDKNTYVTGQVVLVDGGFTCQ